MNKKSLVIILFGLFIVNFVFVSAQLTDEAGQFFGDFVGFIKDTGNSILQAIGFGAFYEGGVDAFAQLLLMIITILLVFTILDFVGFFENKQGILWIISICAGLLAFLYIPASTIQSMAKQYAYMGIAINFILPAAIVLMFVWKIELKAYEQSKSLSPGAAKWLGIGIGVAFEIYLISQLSSLESNMATIVVTIAIILGLAIFVLVFFGGPVVIHKIKGEGKASLERQKVAMESANQAKLEILKEEIDISLRNGNQKRADRLISQFNQVADAAGLPKYKK